jgi:hypothetical protein
MTRPSTIAIDTSEPRGHGLSSYHCVGNAVAAGGSRPALREQRAISPPRLRIGGAESARTFGGGFFGLLVKDALVEIELIAVR